MTKNRTASPCSVNKNTGQPTFGPWFAARLLALGVTPAQFAQQAACSRANVYFWMAARHPPTRTRRPALALLLGVTEAELAHQIAQSWPHAAQPSARRSA